MFNRNSGKAYLDNEIACIVFFISIKYLLSNHKMYTIVLGVSIKKFRCKFKSPCPESAHGISGKFKQYPMLITASCN